MGSHSRTFVICTTKMAALKHDSNTGSSCYDQTVPAQRGGGGWHDACVRCCLVLVAPTTSCHLLVSVPLNPLPPHVAVRIGVSQLLLMPLFGAWAVLRTSQPRMHSKGTDLRGGPRSG